MVDFAPVLNNGFRWLLTGKTQAQPKQELKLTVNGLAQTNLSMIENYFAQHLGVGGVLKSMLTLNEAIIDVKES